MANHRAPRRRASTSSGNAGTPAVGGKRRAAKRSASRGPLFRKLPSAPMVLGVAALTVSATGAVTLGQADVAGGAEAATERLAPANALSGISRVASADQHADRPETVSRDSRRDALADSSDVELQAAAEQQAQQRNAELAKLARSAEKQAHRIALNRWKLPVSGYRLTATFGQSSGLWANTHTGLDFAAPTGTPVMSVTNGTVTSTGYEGAYGNQVIVTTDDGEELWYCHLNEYAVEVGDQVSSGDLVGYVGSTGNTTGPHLHLEVRPGAGDPVDPYAALEAHGLHP